MKQQEKKILLLVLIAWLLIPTGTPDDVITFWLMAQLGSQWYTFAVIMVLLILWNKGVTVHKAHKTAKSFAMGVINGKI